MFAGTAPEGFVAGYPVSALGRYEAELYEYANANATDLLKAIREKGKIDDSMREQLVQLLTHFKDVFRLEDE
jgi:F-type H+-transporting ATPase subunit alpha